MFGGNASTSRKGRIFAASPYAAAAAASRKSYQRPIFDESASGSRRGSSAAATPSPAPSPSPSSSTTSDNGVMSSTARLIFDTLEKMSTPIRDAQKLIPSVNCSPPRAEKRKAIAEQLDWSHGSLKRRRPQLGNTSEYSGQLNGPPLRTVFSPVSASPRSKSTATKSARISSSFVSSGASNSADKRPSKASFSPSSSSYTSNLMPSVSKTTTTSMTTSSLKTKFGSNSSPAAMKTAAEPSSGFSIGLWSSPPSTNSPSDINSTASGGKMRAKVGGLKDHRASAMPKTIVEEEEVDPLPAFLASHNNALPIKTMPSFNFNNENVTKTNSTTSSMSRESSTASTLPLSQMSRQSNLTELQSAPPLQPQMVASTSFSFAAPSEVGSAASRPLGSSDATLSFSFCHPEEVASVSPKNTSDNNSTSPVRSNITTLITANNHRTLPDLTMRSPLGGNSVLSAPKSMKPGSVMDILGSK